jgi:hypothetical protein
LWKSQCGLQPHAKFWLSAPSICLAAAVIAMPLTATKRSCLQTGVAPSGTAEARQVRGEARPCHGSGATPARVTRVGAAGAPLCAAQEKPQGDAPAVLRHAGVANALRRVESIHAHVARQRAKDSAYITALHTPQLYSAYAQMHNAQCTRPPPPRGPTEVTQSISTDVIIVGGGIVRDQHMLCSNR